MMPPGATDSADITYMLSDYTNTYRVMPPNENMLPIGEADYWVRIDLGEFAKEQFDENWGLLVSQVSSSATPPVIRPYYENIRGLLRIAGWFIYDTNSPVEGLQVVLSNGSEILTHAIVYPHIHEG